jgi:hypothetical protein
VLGFLSTSARIYFDSCMIVLLAVASRRPENSIGWVFFAGGFVLSVLVSASNYAVYALDARPGPLPGVEYAAWVATWAPFPVLFLTAAMLFLPFPDGRLPSPLWRSVAWTAVIGSVMAALGEALGREAAGTDYGSIANPIALGGAADNFLQMSSGFGFVLLFLSCLASMASPFIRLSQARGQERQQIKWFDYAAAVMVGGYLLAFSFGSSELLWDTGMLVGFFGFTFVPVATAIAILKYRLYDIDRTINRTLVYGSLTVMLALVYFGGVAATQAMFGGLTGQDDLPQLAIVASPLFIAALFTPCVVAPRASSTDASIAGSTTQPRPSKPSPPGCVRSRTWTGSARTSEM